MKYFVALGLFLVVMYVAFLSFNHIDAWIGLGIVFTNVVALFVYLFKQFNKENQ